MDVSTAFLNGELKDEVYMAQPERFVEKGKENFVCKLIKSIYGLKQAPRCWNVALDSYLKEIGFKQSESDPCIYLRNNGELFVIAVYVDDLLLACKSFDQIVSVKNMCKKYLMPDIGPLKHFLGVQIVQNKDEGKIFMNQQAYAERVLNKFGLSDANSVKSPMDANVKLIAATDDSKLCDPELYQSAIGTLIYLASKTRPDIAFSVYKLARYCSKPSTDHWSLVKRLLRYIKGTSNYGLLFLKQCSDECVGFTDADWAGNLENRKSTSGYCFIMNGSCISWNSSKQNCVALPTAKSEYIALSCAVQEACWLSQAD